MSAQLLLYTSLTDWFLQPWREVFTARYAVRTDSFYKAEYVKTLKGQYNFRTGIFRKVDNNDLVHLHEDD